MTFRPESAPARRGPARLTFSSFILFMENTEPIPMRRLLMSAGRRPSSKFFGRQILEDEAHGSVRGEHVGIAGGGQGTKTTSAVNGPPDRIGFFGLPDLPEIIADIS